VVGDNTGKGLQSALSTAELKFSLKAFAREMARDCGGSCLIDPARLLSRLNSLVVEGIEMDGKPRDAFVCATVAIVDTVTGEAWSHARGWSRP
jgi:serine phosphatase RsbU (regulator of sigma subunit)